MVNKHCSYGTCCSDSRYKDRPNMQGVGFVYFPQPKADYAKCKRWVNACGRPAVGHMAFTVEKITKYTYICSKHFFGGKGPTPEYPDPIPALCSEPEMEAIRRKKKRKPPANRDMSTGSETYKKAKLNSTTLASLSTTSASLCLSDAGPASECGPEDNIPPQNRSENDHENLNRKHRYEQETQSTPVKTIPSIQGTQNTPKLLRYALMKEPKLKKLTCKSTATQTDLTTGQPGVAFSELTDENLSQNIQGLRKELFMSRVFENDNICKFYTGLTVVGFSLVLKLISKTAKRMTYWRGTETGNDGAIPDREHKEKKRTLTIKEELLTTLTRLRLGLEVELLADLMGVSPTTISRITITWIHMLCRELAFLIQWPTRLQVQARFPKAFRFYPKTRVIIDSTEFEIQRATLPSAQRKTYSSYKHRNTGKCLVGITPSGTFSFVSDVWTGCISDKSIVEKFGFCNLLEKGDDIMADRFFFYTRHGNTEKGHVEHPTIHPWETYVTCCCNKDKKNCQSKNSCEESYWTFETI